MPVYEYRCAECGSSSDKFFAASKRPAKIDCDDCDGEARYRISVSKFTDKCYVPEPKRSRSFSGMSLHAFSCRDCGHKADDVVDFGKGETLEDERECPECDSKNIRWNPSFRIDRFSERFPYFDRGLGMLLTSKQHRRDVCKERGLTPVEGDWDIDSHLRKWDDEDDKDEKEYQAYCDKLDNDPAFAEYRQQRDLGLT